MFARALYFKYTVTVMRENQRKESCYSRQMKLLKVLNPNAWMKSGVQHTSFFVLIKGVGCDMLYHFSAGFLFSSAFGVR